MKSTALKLALAALFTSAAVTASAANPFSDVKPSDWAYQSVEKLASEGVVEGYPDGTFKGDKPITRYEMAQITAKLMAKNDLTADQKKEVEKLSGEYASELQNLGVRVSELEKKVSDTQVILDLRFHYQPVYDNIYTGDKKDLFGARLRVNTITHVNDRFYFYGQAETRMGLNGTTYYDPYNHDNGENEFDVTRVFGTYHFGPGDGNNQGLGPSKNIIAVGQFPVTMGVTGYTYDGTVKGVMAQFGDSKKGGKFTIAYGNAADINYDYTKFMMRGVPNFKQFAAGVIQQRWDTIIQGTPAKSEWGSTVAGAIAGTTDYSKLKDNISTALQQKQGLDKETADTAAGILEQRAGHVLGTFADKMDWNTGTYYPMAPDVKMSEGEDEDVPVAYASYIYKNPDKYEIHFYGMKAVGPVGHIAKAWGSALSYNLTDKWNIHGEYVKNMQKLPLNNERPHSFNYGIRYGKADVLQEKSFSIGVDYVYSQAGTYFGGSSNEIADQYMGAIYNSWGGFGRTPAYLADKLTGVLNGSDAANPNANYGGAKFYLAKVQYVPKKGLILEADYGFGAKDMGDRKMDNQFRFLATMYYK